MRGGRTRGFVNRMVPVPAAGPILSVCVAVPDPDHSAAALGDLLGLAVVEVSVVSNETAARWQVPTATGRRMVMVGPAGMFRFVDADPVPALVPLRHLGWAATEVAVTDLDATVSRARRSGYYRLLGAPRPLTSRSNLRAAQVAGTAGEVLYLTEIRGPVNGFELPQPTDPRPTVFAVVVASAALEPTRVVYEERLGGRRASDHELAVGVINDAFGLDFGTLRRVSSVQLDGRCFVEIDKYPPDAAPAPSPGCLPSGTLLIIPKPSVKLSFRRLFSRFLVNYTSVVRRARLAPVGTPSRSRIRDCNGKRVGS